MASSRRFEDLKDELIALKEQIRIHLRRNSHEVTINKMFLDGDKLLEQLKAEAERCPASVAAEMSGRLFAVRNEWAAFRKTARRPALLIFIGGTRSAVLQQGIDSLQSTGVSLHRAEMAARESEEIGASVLDELNSQREQLLGARGRLDEGNANLRRSGKLIRHLNMGLATNKCLLLLIIALEIVILLVVVYLKFIRQHHWF
ncbi:Vesicle transport through interaction with t-SNAREs 1B [Tyrophagus putrescentiae]|nr:Vesicle transport through interaction with t-SNAREs 1B [Tyrophagus putrescentiae]